MNKKELKIEIVELKEEIEDLEDRVKGLEVRDGAFFGYAGNYMNGYKNHAGKFDKLLKYLGVGYKEGKTTISEGKFHKASSKKKKA